MSDRTHQALSNLTYEVIIITVDQLQFYQRLHKSAPKLITAHDVQVVEERLHRLRSLFKGLEKHN